MLNKPPAPHNKVEITGWSCNDMCMEVSGEKNLYGGVADPGSLNGIAISY